MPILLDVSDNTTGRRKGGGRAPARAREFHNVSIRLAPSEHQAFRMAAGHAGLSGGELVARWARRYLARVGVRINSDDEQEDDTL